MNNKKYLLRYTKPAADYSFDTNLDEFDSHNKFKGIDNPWENLSLPIGNGAIGANIFGGTNTERIQITENSFANPMAGGCGLGLNNLAELYIDFSHTDVTGYERTLSLNDAIADVKYISDNTAFKREYFAVHNRNLLVIGLSSENKTLSFNFRIHSPFEKDYALAEGDGKGKSSSIRVDNDTLFFESRLHWYNVICELGFSVETDGEYSFTDNGFVVKSAQNAVIYVAVGSNYRVCEKVFTESRHEHKLDGMPHPHESVVECLKKAKKEGYQQLKEEHLKDYREFFDRISLSFGGTDDGRATDELLWAYKAGEKSLYLEELLYHYGRYLLISSCREDTLPPNLQGVWNQYSDSPWTAGYWHNVNIQMNYWLAFACNLDEKFQSYVNFFKAFLPLARKCADDYVKAYFPENYSGEGKNGWNIGTGCWPYHIYGVGISDHSGPATAAFTAMLFWDYYDHTRDRKLLKSLVYPIVYEVSLYLSKSMVEVDGKWLIKYSASPEQWQDGKTYRTTGAAFDQQLCYEVFCHTVYGAELFGLEDDFTQDLKKKIPLLDPYLYGESGQIKEFREEKYYGDIGEKHHRHISHLLGVYPGIRAPFNDEKFKNAVKTTVDLRGFSEIGWAEVHRMCLWARMGESDKAYAEFKYLLTDFIHDNLWNGVVAPFQIDGNLGVVAGVNEMLLQSHNGYIELIPNLTESFSYGSFNGLIARGGFEVSLCWENCKPVRAEIKSLSGEELKVRLPQDASGSINGTGDAQYNTQDGIVTVDTSIGDTYIFEFNYPAKG
ncbi:MAG: glycoside hydrolase N-terminal domain-containing protein [Clostridia bacterium]|nr:glycoside hydrolase N-terminal domain-containing protein [Clostridia bacterium]